MSLKSINEDKKAIIYVRSYVITHTNKELFDVPVEIIFKHKVSNRKYLYVMKVENDSKIYVVSLSDNVIEMNVYTCIDYQKSDVYSMEQ